MEKEKIEKIVFNTIDHYLPSTKRGLKKKNNKGYQTYFQGDLGFDSLKTVELFLECEKTFGIIFTDDEINYTKTIEELINNIEEKLKQKNK